MDIFSDEVPSWACKGMCGIHAAMRKAQTEMEQELKKHNVLMLSKQLYSKSHPTYAIEMKQWFGEQRRV